MPSLTVYAKPEWWLGVAGWPTSWSSTPIDTDKRNRCIFYVKQLKVHVWGGDVGGSEASPALTYELDPPGKDELLSEFSGKYGNRLQSGDEWWGGVSGASSSQRYYPADGDWDYVWGEGQGYNPWSYNTAAVATPSWPSATWPARTNSNIQSDWEDYDRMFRISLSAGSGTYANQWFDYTSTLTDDHTGSNRGSFSSANFTWTAGSGTSDKDAGEWEDEVRLVEADIVSAVAVNGRYPEYPATTATFGTYTAATNTYVAGADQALNADDWYTEFSQAVTALQAAITRIGTLRTDLDGAATVRDPEAEEDEFPEGSGPTPDFSWREQDLGDEELIEFPEIEFQLPEDPPPPPKQDAVEVPGLIRLARFAKPTDNVAAFSESTHSEPSFTPRESISPEFNKEEE